MPTIYEDDKNIQRRDSVELIIDGLEFHGIQLVILGT
jgi:hypothetical protein